MEDEWRKKVEKHEKARVRKEGARGLKAGDAFVPHQSQARTRGGLWKVESVRVSDRVRAWLRVCARNKFILCLSVCFSAREESERRAPPLSLPFSPSLSLSLPPSPVSTLHIPRASARPYGKMQLKELLSAGEKNAQAGTRERSAASWEP